MVAQSQSISGFIKTRLFMVSCLYLAMKNLKTVSLPFQKRRVLKKTIFLLLLLFIYPDSTGVFSQAFILVGQ